MKRFKFPLERLLEIRRHKENLIKNELAKAQRKKVKLLQEKEELLNKYKQGLNELKIMEKENILSIQKFNNFQSYFNFLKNETEKKDKIIKLADEEIAIISKKLIEARKERRIIERLKEKALKKYFYELQKEEQEFFDEVGMNKFIEKMIKEEKTVETKEIPIPLKLPEIEDLTKKLYEEIMGGGK
jgi:flagellar FliJ protein